MLRLGPPDTLPVNTEARRQKLLENGLTFLVAGVWGAWRAMSQEAGAVWFSLYAGVFMWGLVFLCLGLSSLFTARRRGARNGQFPGKTDPADLFYQDIELPPGHAWALAAGYLSVLTVVAALILFPAGVVSLFQGAPAAPALLGGAVAAALASRWLIRSAAQRMKSAV
jgi:hypothetical protein